MSRTRVSTRWLLVLGALAAVQAVLIIAFGPIGAALALAGPPLYALAAWVSVLVLAVACHFDLRPGMITLMGLAAAVIAVPFSVLGFLLIPLITLQALAMELAAFAARRLPTWSRAFLVALAGQTASFFMSLVVISPENLVPLMILLIVAARLVGVVALAIASTYVARGLRAAGLERSIEGRA